MSNVYKLGFYSSVSTAALSAATFLVAILTPPMSGPFCTGSCFSYPFSDAISRFPRDYYWMYPAILLSILFILLMVSIHHYAASEKKIFSHTGLIFAVMGSGILIADYFLQLSVIQPSLLSGESDGVGMLSQFNPHGVFIALEELGFLLMSLAYFFMAFVFSGSKLANAVRYAYLLIFTLTLFALIVILLQYGLHREYRFEVAAISISWFGLIISSIMLAVLFKGLMSRVSERRIE